MIHLLPQIPCKNRYTEDWIEIWIRELKNLGIPFKVIGDRTPIPITKFFFDPIRALEYESNQINILSKDNPEMIFCLDVDTPGLSTPAIQTLRLVNSSLKCFGYLHAGSWCNGDIWTGIPGKKTVERAMFDVFDKIFVATNYHKRKIEKYFGEKFGNIEVVGFPFYKKDVFNYVKPLSFGQKCGILINGRSEQSNVDLIDKLKKKSSKVDVIKAKSRKEYYNLLNKAKVVLSLKTEETFGIGQLEAYVLGSIPLCPSKFAYPEVISDECLLYSSEEDLMDKLDYLLHLNKNDFQINVDKYEQSIPKMVENI